MSLAAVISITLILMLAGINLLLGHALSGVLDSYRSKVSEISISVADQTPLTTVYEFEARLKADPRVAGVEFLTKDQELASFESNPSNRAIAAEIQGNPVAAKLVVRVRKLSDVAAINQEAVQWRGADKTDPTDYQGDFISRMVRLSQWLDWIGLGIIAVLTLVSVVIIMNTIRTAVYHRRQEIEVMKLVGATEWFVRGPFVLEGVMTGVLAATVALGVLVVVYQPFVDRFQSSLVFIPLAYDPSFISQLARDLILGGALLGALGSYIGVRRFVRI